MDETSLFSKERSGCCMKQIPLCLRIKSPLVTVVSEIYVVCLKKKFSACRQGTETMEQDSLFH